MQVAINLTPVLVTLIICVFLYAMCKMARKDGATSQDDKKVVPIRSAQEQHLREYVEDQVKKGERKE